MKRALKLVAVFLVVIIAFGIFVNCYGSFALFHRIHKWNGTIGNQWLRSIVHFLMWFPLPVYPICLFIDWLILNNLEFFGFGNPMSMAPGEEETKVVVYNGQKYRITVSQNRVDLEQLTGELAGQMGALIFNPEDKSWSVENKLMMVREKVAQMDENDPNVLHVVHPDGHTERVDMTTYLQ